MEKTMEDLISVINKAQVKKALLGEHFHQVPGLFSKLLQEACKIFLNDFIEDGFFGLAALVVVLKSGLRSCAVNHRQRYRRHVVTNLRCHSHFRSKSEGDEY